MQLVKFFPTSNDPYLVKESDMALAKFGHINELLKYIPASTNTTTALSVTSSTTFVNVPGMSFNVESGGVYAFKIYLNTNGTAATPGCKVALSGTSTWSSITATAAYYTAAAVAVANSTSTTPGTAIGGGAAAYLAVVIEGVVNVNTLGTFTVQFAQNVSNASASIVKENSSFILTRIS